MVYTEIYRHFREIYYMSDMRYMNREHKKRLLRSNIVKLPRPEQTDYEDDEEDDEGYGEDDAEEEQIGRAHV